ncbi:ladinin-1 [Tenrec ecaudatus]|uniref:ladinin-1 n=1 Tax=Tenrec ecaudatus TaxID=94439 RepID=UPI003F5940FA
MSVSRKDWSALSSLARQRSIEDEEERERERRRRHRNLSSTSEESPKLTQNGDRLHVDRLPSVGETEAPTPPPQVSKDDDEDYQAILRTRQERRQRRRAVEAAQAQAHTPARDWLEAEEGGAGALAPPPARQAPAEQADAPARPRLSREPRSPGARQDEHCADGEPGDGGKGLPKSPGSEKPSPSLEKTASGKNADSEKAPLAEKGRVSGKRSSVPEKTSAFEKSASEKTSLPEKSPVSGKPSSVPEKTLAFEKRLSLEKRSVSEKSPVSGKTSVSEKALVFERRSAPEKPSPSEKSPVAEKASIPEKRAAFERRSASEKTLSPEEAPVSEKTAAPEKRPVSEKTLGSDRTEKTPPAGKTLVSEEAAVSEKKSAPEKMGTLEKASAPEKSSSSERRLVSERASIFEKTPAPETKPTLKKAVTSEQSQAREQLASAGVQPTTKGQRRTLSEKSPPPSAEPREQGEPNSPTVASRLPAFSFQVKIPSKEEEADPTSPTQVTYSSSLKRSSSRTISFRMSPRKDNSEMPLTRSASVRLPSSSFKLGEKLERYHTAIQRSESVKSPGSSRTEFFVTPVGVASKRHLFEKGLSSQSQAEPASSRKDNLRLSGVVTSRLNLWISRTQESGEQDSQEVQKEAAATRRTQWGKKPDTPLDAEV